MAANNSPVSWLESDFTKTGVNESSWPALSAVIAPRSRSGHGSGWSSVTENRPSDWLGERFPRETLRIL